jgi:hypothetical protein
MEQKPAQVWAERAVNWIHFGRYQIHADGQSALLIKTYEIRKGFQKNLVKLW